MNAGDLSGFLLFDAVLRFSALGILILMTVLLLRDAGGTWAGRLSAVFALGVGAYLFCSYGPARAAAESFVILLHAICTAVPALLWLAAQAIFVDGFRLRAWHLGTVAGLEALGPLAHATLEETGVLTETARAGHHMMVVFLYGHALYVAWAGRLDDLVEARREFRRVFVGLTAVLGLVVAGVEFAQGRTPAPPALETLAAATVLTATLILSLAAIRIDARQLFLAPAPVSADRGEPRREALAAPDRHILDLLRKAMEVDRLYRQEGLTISLLAERLRVPEHQLRRAINAGLGHRNFNAFLNRYRIEEIKEALADPARARLPILTLAMEAGYGSLAPFNRAFKDEVGLTPSAYRRLKLGTDALRGAPAGRDDLSISEKS